LITTEQSTVAANRGAVYLNCSDPETVSKGGRRARFMCGKHDIDLLGIESAKAALDAVGPADVSGSSQMKEAFLFLLMDDVAISDVWDQFFAAAPVERLSIYLHRAQPSGGELPLKRHGAIDVPWTNS
jgi:hypothetical protein